MSFSIDCVSQTRVRSGPTLPPTPSRRWQLMQASVLLLRYSARPRCGIALASGTSLRDALHLRRAVRRPAGRSSSPRSAASPARRPWPACLRRASDTCGSRSRGSFLSRNSSPTQLRALRRGRRALRPPRVCERRVLLVEERPRPLPGRRRGRGRPGCGTLPGAAAPPPASSPAVGERCPSAARRPPCR